MKTTLSQFVFCLPAISALKSQTFLSSTLTLIVDLHSL
ncbi:hypothetical protein M595_4931 [Lyngbya aestuarii BL J]|uniref:Uncharacterized protein n=1 Tax=Lyngbya aestuarii BL J TaxID=1348334 RepID=U7QBA1_9CYAN|nr:hypothetical protein M595_4931 [Lyngbya aestuarii BL J]